MTYKGHIEDGKVVFDEPAPLRDGTEVTVLVEADARRVVRGQTPLRGTPYRYDAPFEPAVPPEDWDAVR